MATDFSTFLDAKNPRRSYDYNRVVLNTPLSLTLTSANFDDYMNVVNAVFDLEQPFQWIQLIEAAEDNAIINVQKLVNGVETSFIEKYRVGTFIPCLGNKILIASTDATAVIKVGMLAPAN